MILCGVPGEANTGKRTAEGLGMKVSKALRQFCMAALSTIHPSRHDASVAVAHHQTRTNGMKIALLRQLDVQKHWRLPLYSPVPARGG